VLVTIGAQLAATGVAAAGVLQAPQVSVLEATTGLLEVEVDQTPQVSVVLLEATTGLVVVVVVDQTPHVSVVVATTGLVVVVVVDVHGFHRSSVEEATAEAEATPTMAAAATTDFILIVLGWFWTRKSDCGQRLLARKSD
jgi:HJR/Mrr/RecB family endonuclease